MARYHGTATATKTIAASDEVGSVEPRGAPLDGDDRGDHQAGNHHRQRALGEEAERSGGRRQQQPAARAGDAIADGDERRANRRGDEEGERQVGQGHAAQRDVAEAGGDDGPGDQRRVVVVPPPRQAGGDEDQADASQRRPQPGGARPRPGDPEGRRRQPVVEDRLLEARLVVEGRGQPVARLDHLAGCLGVERFVGIGDRRCAEPGQEGQAGDDQQRSERTPHASNCSGTRHGSAAARTVYSPDGHDQGSAERIAARRRRRRHPRRLERQRVHPAEAAVRPVPVRGIDRASRSATAPTTASASPPANARCRRRPRATRRRL